MSSLTLTSQIFLCPVHSRSPAFYIYTRSDRPRRICKDTDVCDHSKKERSMFQPTLTWIRSTRVAAMFLRLKISLLFLFFSFFFFLNIAKNARMFLSNLTVDLYVDSCIYFNYYYCNDLHIEYFCTGFQFPCVNHVALATDCGP